VEGLGLTPEKISIDYDKKLVALDLGGQPMDKDAVNKALASRGYSVAP